MQWLKKNISLICMVFALVSGIFVLVSWGIGYYANALFGYKFQIESCWQGLTALGLGGVGLLKWLIDSVHNSEKGDEPQ